MLLAALPAGLQDPPSHSTHHCSPSSSPGQYGEGGRYVSFRGREGLQRPRCQTLPPGHGKASVSHHSMQPPCSGLQGRISPETWAFSNSGQKSGFVPSFLVHFVCARALQSPYTCTTTYRVFYLPSQTPLRGRGWQPLPSAKCSHWCKAEIFIRTFL